jgi:hypothetical protein
LMHEPRAVVAEGGDDEVILHPGSGRPAKGRTKSIPEIVPGSAKQRAGEGA